MGEGGPVEGCYDKNHLFEGDLETRKLKSFFWYGWLVIWLLYVLPKNIIRGVLNKLKNHFIAGSDYSILSAPNSFPISNINQKKLKTIESNSIGDKPV
ncbi:MAG: hypothetical protein P1P90_00985 [Patescibacteria group bacterium]|nr:hypothetical protein [Patescibacteria group bacterium]